MFKHVTIIAALLALLITPSSVLAEKGTWGKGTPQADKTPTQFSQLLTELRGAYQDRDGEKMSGIIKQLESAGSIAGHPRIETWINNVKEAYKEEDIRAMGRLLNRADLVADAAELRSEGSRGPSGMMRGMDSNFAGRMRGLDAFNDGQDRQNPQNRQRPAANRQDRRNRGEGLPDQLRAPNGPNDDNAADMDGRPGRGFGRQNQGGRDSAAPLAGQRQNRRGFGPNSNQAERPMMRQGGHDAFGGNPDRELQSGRRGQFRWQGQIDMNARPFGRSNQQPFAPQSNEGFAPGNRRAPESMQGMGGMRGFRGRQMNPQMRQVPGYDNEQRGFAPRFQGRMGQSFGRPDFAPQGFAPRSEFGNGFGRGMTSPRGGFNQQGFGPAGRQSQNFEPQDLNADTTNRPLRQQGEFAPRFQGRNRAGQGNQQNRDSQQDFWEN